MLSHKLLRIAITEWMGLVGFGLTAVRERLTARLAALDTKEDNLLDLATDGELPKEKIKERLIGIRDDRASIRRDIERLDAELETERQVFFLALDLLEHPQELYRQAGPQVRLAGGSRHPSLA